MDTPVGDYRINLLTQVGRPNEMTPTTLLTDTITCQVSAAKEEGEALKDEVLEKIVQEPKLDPEPASHYSFEAGKDATILIELGQAIDPQGVSDVEVTVKLG